MLTIKIISTHSFSFFLAFSFGVSMLFLLPQFHSPHAGWWLLVVFILPRFLLPAGLGFVCGIIYAWLAVSDVVQSRLPANWQENPVVVTGKVQGIPTQTDTASRFDFLLEPGKQPMQLRKVRVSWYGTLRPHIVPGQRWQFTVRLKKPQGRFNAAGFDYEKWLLWKRIDASASVRQKAPKKLLADKLTWQDKMDRFRYQISHDVLKSFATQPLLAALLVGDRSVMQPAHWQVLQRTGTSHLMAISGLHLGLVALAVFVVLRRLCVWLPWVRQYSLPIALLLALVLAGMYAVLAGWSLATQRAWLMLLVTGVAVLTLQRVSFWHVLTLAFFLSVIFDPLSVLSVGFWLSFGAVFWIVLLAQIYSVRGVRGLVVMQLLLGFGLLPILANAGFGISLLSLPANLVALPLVGMVIMPLLFAGFIEWFFSASTYVFAVTDWLFSWLWKYLSLLSDQPLGFAYLPDPALWQVCVAMLAVAVVLLPRGLPGKGLGIFLFVATLWPQPQVLDTGTAKATVLDVGQGLSVLVRTKNHALLYDTGAHYKGSQSVFRTSVAPVLRKQLVHTLDYLIVSHGDNDHAGGAQDVLAAMPATQVISDEPITGAHPCISRQWRWDGVDFMLAKPGKHTHGNDASCILYVRSAEQGLLLLSDLEKKGEAMFLQQYPSLNAEVLLVPHHGSNTSSTKALLAQLQPKWSIVSSGYQNRYRHPHPKVLARLAEVSSNVINTAEAGAVEITLSPQHIKVQSYRKNYGSFWHRW